MELRQIHYFLAVARHLNFTTAAKECFVTQSTLSEQIKKLEEEFECKLFERTSKKVTLTFEGELFRSYCEKINEFLEEAKSKVGKNHKEVFGKIRLAALPTVMLSWLPLLITEFKRDFPNIQFEMKELGSGDIEKSLSNYVIDFGITNLPLKDPSLHSTVLYKEKLVLITSKNEDSAKRNGQTVKLEDFKDEPFIIYENGYDLRGVILNAFFEAGCSPNIVIENGRTESIKYFVECGLGVALIPEAAIYYQPNIDNICWHYVEPDIVRPVGLATRNDQPHSLFLKKFLSRLIHFEKRKTFVQKK
ncbi:LysR family transcriptional regulator [Siminovitchia sediminis]|uniref:LysR family transcriptional regulator n=1 Tax=Siminovitchia sediminis TaxID=1274353 RepID=A0ABW4KMJ9_9BACI